MKKAIVELNWNFKTEFEDLDEAIHFAETALDHSDHDSIEIRIEKIKEIQDHNETDQEESEVIEDVT